MNCREQLVQSTVRLEDRDQEAAGVNDIAEKFVYRYFSL